MKLVKSVRITKALADECKASALQNLSHEQLKAVLKDHGELWWLAASVLPKERDSK